MKQVAVCGGVVVASLGVGILFLLLWEVLPRPVTVAHAIATLAIGAWRLAGR